MSLDILAEFRSQFLIFLDELIAQFPDEGDIVILRLFVSTQMSADEMVKKFLYELDSHEGSKRVAIKERDESFFLDYSLNQDTADLFKISHFKKLWNSGQLDDEDKRIFWQWMDTFMFLADKYTKSLVKEMNPDNENNGS